MTEASLNLEKKSRLERITLRIAELERQKRRLLILENKKERKTRTRRLIQIGAIAVKYLNLPENVEPKEFELVIRKALGIQ